MKDRWGNTEEKNKDSLVTKRKVGVNRGGNNPTAHPEGREIDRS